MLSCASLNTVHASFPPGPRPRYTDSALESCTASLQGTVTCPAPGRLLHLSSSPLKSPRRLSLRLTTLPSSSPRKSKQRQRTSTTAPTTLTRPLGLAPRIQEPFTPSLVRAGLSALPSQALPLYAIPLQRAFWKSCELPPPQSFPAVA